MDRRQALCGLTAMTALALAGCASPTPQDAHLRTPVPTFTTTPGPRPTPEYVPPRTGTRKVPPPNLEKITRPRGALYQLPGEGNLLAWTVDDGVSSEVVAAYAKFAATTGTRITFFPNGVYSSWTENAAALRPLVDSGQVQLGNHTYSHPDLTGLSDGGIVNELQKNAAVLKNTFGVDPAPYYRPPYGYLDDRVQRVASGIGYTAPVMWYGSLGDAAVLEPWQVLSYAQEWFLPQHIVLGHANHPAVTAKFPQLRDVIRQRGLQTVTLDDVFLK
ncbi:MAG: polysaccharide deacetylase family protein [Cryobacterium sp.]|nr:polysaccharide deacetylase family protein [Cryobacterium sp.]